MNATIYVLIDPSDNEVRYVGKTVQLLPMRLQQHTFVARTGRSTHAAARWMKGLSDRGLRPIISPVETVKKSEWQDAERRWVSHYKAKGANLTNDAPPGSGGDNSYSLDMTPEIVGRLGTVPDQELATELGVTRKAISYHRRIRGIRACGNRESTRSAPPAMGGHNRIGFPEGLVSRFGTVPDHVLAEEFGVDKSVIMRRRRSMGVASFAANTGRTGKFRRGNFPARWLKSKGSAPGGQSQP